MCDTISSVASHVKLDLNASLELEYPEKNPGFLVVYTDQSTRPTTRINLSSKLFSWSQFVLSIVVNKNILSGD